MGYFGYFFQVFFSVLHPLFFIRDYNYMYISWLTVFLPFINTFFIFVFFYCFCFILNGFCWHVLKTNNCFLWNVLSVINTIHYIFMSDIVVFVSKSLIQVFLYIFYASALFIELWNPGIITDLMCFSANFNTRTFSWIDLSFIIYHTFLPFYMPGNFLLH